MEQDISARLEVLEKKIDHMYQSIEKIRKYFLVSTIITVVMFVLPLIVLIFAIPYIIHTFSGLYEGLL
ncbi:MAG: hypothetical protein KAI72_05195 [Candidatus Pacebacteria bacterium]|nr:hypothetical protein [Candidatus Paceibacterota bacterium]